MWTEIIHPFPHFIGHVITFHIGIKGNHFQCREVITSAMVSQITGVSIGYSTVCSGVDQRKYQSSASPVTGKFPEQRTSNAENISIWWRHHVISKRGSSKKSQNSAWLAFSVTHPTVGNGLTLLIRFSVKIAVRLQEYSIKRCFWFAGCREANQSGAAFENGL